MWLQARVGVNDALSAVSSSARVAGGERNESVGMVRRQIESRGYYTEHGIRVSTQVNRLAQRVWIAAKVGLPKRIADHGEARPASHIFPGRNDPAQHRLYA